MSDTTTTTSGGGAEPPYTGLGQLTGPLDTGGEPHPTRLAGGLVAKIAACAARETPGVHSTGCRGDRSTHPAPDRSPAGVSAAVQESTASIGLILATWYGHNIADIAEAVRHNVVHRVHAMTGLTVTAVSITVDDVVVAEPTAAHAGAQPAEGHQGGHTGSGLRTAGG